MANEDLTFVQRGDTTVKFAFPDAGGEKGSFSGGICIAGDFTINDSLERITMEVSNWCRQQTPGAIASATDGERTIDASFTADMVISDATFQKLIDNYETSNAPIWIEVERKDKKTAATTWKEELRGRITQLNRTDRETGTSQISPQIEIHEIVTGSFSPDATT